MTTTKAMYSYAPTLIRYGRVVYVSRPSFIYICILMLQCQPVSAKYYILPLHVLSKLLFL